MLISLHKSTKGSSPLQEGMKYSHFSLEMTKEQLYGKKQNRVDRIWGGVWRHNQPEARPCLLFLNLHNNRDIMISIQIQSL